MFASTDRRTCAASGSPPGLSFVLHLGHYCLDGYHSWMPRGSVDLLRVAAVAAFGVHTLYFTLYAIPLVADLHLGKR